MIIKDIKQAIEAHLACDCNTHQQDHKDAVVFYKQLLKQKGGN